MKLFLFTAIMLFSSQALAKVAYVDLMKAFENTTQGKAVKSRLKRESEKAQKNFKTLEQNLQKEEAKLKQEAAMLSEQARMQKVSQFQQKVLNFQRDAKNKDAELQALQTKMMSPILTRLRSTIGDIAKKESYTVVENIGPEVLWVSPKLDLTTKVYKAYNRKYK